MNSIKNDDANRLSRLDEFMIEEILADDERMADEGVVERFHAILDKAEIAARKRRLVELRTEIDREQLGATVVPFDRDRMRAKLRETANDPHMKMTLAARGGVSDSDDDMEGLLEDLAELERDTEDDGRG